MIWLPLPFSQEAGDVNLGRIGIVGLKELSVVELLAESCAFVGRERLWLFRNSVLGLSLFRSELPDELRIAICERLRQATCWHGNGVGCLVELERRPTMLHVTVSC